MKMRARLSRAAVRDEFAVLRAMIHDLFSMHRIQLEAAYRKGYPSCDRPLKDLSREYMLQGLILLAVHHATNVLDVD